MGQCKPSDTDYCLKASFWELYARTRMCHFLQARLKHLVVFFPDLDRGRQAGEEERPASTGKEAQSENEDGGSAHREQTAGAAVRSRT